MSFPFLQPYAGLSNSLQTAQAAGGGGAVGGWVELGRTTLGSAGDNITVSSLSDKRYYMVLCDTIPTGNVDFAWRSGNGSVDTGNNYASRSSSDGGADSTSNTTDRIRAGLGGTISTPQFHMGFWANLSSKEKLFQGHSVGQNTAGAGTAPSRRENVGKWVSTSNPLDSLTGFNNGAGSHNTGSELVVLGWDPADTHTSNFWEELASVTLGGDASEISSGTISAKKYLCVQVYLKTASNSNDVLVQFNNDTGSNYAHRNSNIFNSDTTGTSQSNARLIDRNGTSDKGRFVNFFVINNSANEKLIISHGVEEETSGASNPPTSAETVAKWTNTSSQITEIDCFTETGNLRSGAIMKVWGSD